MGKRLSSLFIVSVLVFALIFSFFAIPQVTKADNEVISAGDSVNFVFDGENYTHIYSINVDKSGLYRFYSTGDAYPFVYIEDAEGYTIIRGFDYYNTAPNFDLSYYLREGETYYLEILADASFTFYMEYVSSQATYINAGEVTLTDYSGTFDLSVTSYENLSGAEWVCSDDSVVYWTEGSESWDPSLSIWESSVTLIANKTGTARVSLINPDDGTVYASCDVNCEGITDWYNVYVGGVRANSTNLDSITGRGISGSVSYDLATNTLTLNNATITSAGFTYGDDGYPVAAIAAYGSDTLHIRLIGTNKIENVSYPESNPADPYGYAFISYTGIEGIDCASGLSFEGEGLLSINDDFIGSAIKCEDLAVASSVTLNITQRFSECSEGIDARNVTVDGSVRISNSTGYVTAHGISAKKLVISESGSLEAVAETSSEISSYPIHIKTDGLLEVKGKLIARASGAVGEEAGVGIEAVDEDTVLLVSGDGSVIASGEYAATDNIKLKTGDGIKVAVGDSADSVKKINASEYSDGSKYLVVAKKISGISSDSGTGSDTDTSAGSGSDSGYSQDLKAQTVTVSNLSRKFKASKLKKKALKFKIKASAEGRVVFAKKSGSSKLSVKKTGRVTWDLSFQFSETF